MATSIAMMGLSGIAEAYPGDPSVGSGYPNHTDSVVCVQKFNHRYIADPPIEVDGAFGPQTAYAIEQIQVKLNQALHARIEVDGVVGPRTADGMLAPSSAATSGWTAARRTRATSPSPADDWRPTSSVIPPRGVHVRCRPAAFQPVEDRLPTL
ncbi:peptidoglycan-binding domain-containing protein [Kitasatospora sp. NPDC127111]|uniref:peptidoglycan-binding domain-containing protein n=1 Tax=Kitasatospora sp. NPDC127111 TaxID=3345363 RepID=UPI0036329475